MTCLEMAGVAEFSSNVPRWTGGDTIVVQLGDILDRGDAEIASLMLLRQLGRQAEREGGAVHVLNGNHEGLNVCGDFRCARHVISAWHSGVFAAEKGVTTSHHSSCVQFRAFVEVFCGCRYVTSGAFTESGMIMGLSGAQLQDLEMLVRARLALYTPGQPMAMELSKNPTVLIVNDTVFAHGGLLPEHAEYGIEKINAEVAAWMRADEVDDGSHALPPFVALGCAAATSLPQTLCAAACYPTTASCSASLLTCDAARGISCSASHLLFLVCPAMQPLTCVSVHAGTPRA